MTMVTERDQPPEVPERWSAKAKTEVVLRLLRGETIDAVSREIQVPAHEIETWRRQFLDGGVQQLKHFSARLPRPFAAPRSTLSRSASEPARNARHRTRNERVLGPYDGNQSAVWSRLGCYHGPPSGCSGSYLNGGAFPLAFAPCCAAVSHCVAVCGTTPRLAAAVLARAG
jgi:hypothetical protein